MGSIVLLSDLGQVDPGFLVWLACVVSVVVMWDLGQRVDDDTPFRERFAGWCFGVLYYSVIAAFPIGLIDGFNVPAAAAALLVGFTWAVMWLPLFAGPSRTRRSAP